MMMNSIIPIEIEIRNESRNKKNVPPTPLPPPQSQPLPPQQRSINRQFNDHKQHLTNTYTEHTLFKSSNINNNNNNNNNIVQNLSPIKPSFVNIKEDYSNNNFTHSTPNNQFHVDASPTPPQQHIRPSNPVTNGKHLPLIVNTIIEEKTFRTEHIIRKQNIVKELAVNILELNDYKTRTEQLDNELKNCMKLKNEDLTKQQQQQQQNHNAIIATNKNQSASSCFWINEKSEAIQNELTKLKSEMMQKIEDIHELELELVKLEGNNASSKSKSTHQKHEINNLAYRNEEVINEIRKLLKENGHYFQSQQQPQTCIGHNNNKLTVNKVLEDYTKAAEATARYINSDLTAIKDSMQQRFDFLKNQIEQEYSFLRNRLRQLDEKCSHSYSTTNHIEINNEMECIKNLMRTSREKYEREKNFLFKDLNANEFIDRHFETQKNQLERVIAERQNEMQSLMRNFYSKLPYNSNNNNNNAVSSTTASVVFTNNHNRSELSCNVTTATTNNSSFLTEEEETIRKISEKIRYLKARIDSKKSRKKMSTASSSSATEYYEEEEEEEEEVEEEEQENEVIETEITNEYEDEDETELYNLNEQIKLLKSKMQAKGDEIGQFNTFDEEISNQYFEPEQQQQHNQQQDQQLVKKSSIRQNGNIYLPITNENNNNNNNMDYMGTYRIEPIQITNQETYINRPNFNEHHKATKKVIILDKNTNPMNKKYKSTIEIHAEHLQKLQKQNNGPRCRSLSSSVSSLVTVSTSSHNNHHQQQQQSNRKKQQHKQQQQQQISITSTPKKRHQSAVYIKHVPTDSASNLVSVNLKAYKQQDHQNELIQNLEKSQKEIENLRHLLTERNELIEMQKKESDSKQKELLKLNESKLNDMKNNDHLLKQLEEQKSVILNLKAKLTKLNKEGNLDSDTMSSISNSIDKVRQNVKQNLKKYDNKQTNSKRKSSVDASVQASSDTPKSDSIETSSLVCNIPEHHRLEDLLHDNREYITKLKTQIKSSQNVNEMTLLLDKKAEFEALDLAINTRKQQLYNLELAKNRKLNEQQQKNENNDISYTSNDNTLLKDEINCLEQTLRKRNKELDQVQMQIKTEKKELQHLADSKFNIEKELDSLKRQYNIINKEINIYDRKAEEATINLIVAQEELDWAKDLKKTIEYDVEKIKIELVNYLRRLKANNFESNSKYHSLITHPDLYLTEIEQKKLIDEQKFHIEELNSEIEAKKFEVESIKEQSQTYFKQFRNEMEKNESYLLNTKKSHESLQCEINEMKQLLDELNSETKLKQQSLHDKNVLVETLELSIKKFKTINEEESKKLDDLEAKITQTYNEFENADKKFKKLCENINLLQTKENELTCNLNKLSNQINSEKEEYEKLKLTNDDLNLNKCDLESKCGNLNDALDKMNEELHEREQQLNKIIILTKEKHALLKQDEEQLADLEYEKENLNQETNMLKDKFNRKKIEYDRLEQNNKQLNEKFSQNELEINNYVHKLFESKQNYEKCYNSVKEVDFKLKELNLKVQQKHGQLEQLNAELLDRKEEITGFDTFLDEIRRDTHQEKKELNLVKTEINKQKKNYEELKAKCKNYVKFIENSENNMGKLQELTDDLNEKCKYIQELEAKLMEKNQEYNILNQNFQKFQEDSLSFKNRLKELDDASKRNSLIENDLKKFLNNLEPEYHCSLNSRSTAGATVLCVPKQRPSCQVSSLLIQPTIRKTYSSDILLTDHSMPKLTSTTTDQLNEKTNTILDEQNKYKENLIEKFHEKLNNLDKSKCQTKSIIDNLKSNLNEIEAMTANSIFKLTGGGGLKN